ncbi:hypothetical protein H4R20_002889 [Coemansia guatemalensis]|uniref:Uncharacterized protein n=1 Tax=Coemansia guatemalensis TaxID=2761395 RepID=A0A9W8LT60_9FUNG|nr:hypothetical protein H4R20_002889 [Coemansia guatemalensis]
MITSSSDADSFDGKYASDDDANSFFELSPCLSNHISVSNGGNMLGFVSMDNSSQLSIASGSRTLAKVNRAISKTRMLHHGYKQKTPASNSADIPASSSTTSLISKSSGRAKRAVSKLIHLPRRAGRARKSEAAEPDSEPASRRSDGSC